MIYKEWGIIIEALRLLKQEKMEQREELQNLVKGMIEEGGNPADEERNIQKISKDIVAINNIVAKIHCMNFS